MVTIRIGLANLLVALWVVFLLGMMLGSWRTERRRLAHKDSGGA